MIDIADLGYDDPDHPLFNHPDDLSNIGQIDDLIKETCKLRELGEVIEGVGMRFGEFDFPSILVHPQHLTEKSYAALSYDAVREVLTKPDIFSNSIHEEISGELWGRSIAVMDPPEHGKFRRHMQRGFTPKLVKSWEDNVIKPMIEERFAAIRHKGKANLTRELTGFYPYQIFCEVVGFDARDVTKMAKWLKMMNRFAIDPAEGMKGSVAMKEYALNILNERRAKPKNDLISALTEAEIDEGKISDEQFVAAIIHLIQGGVDTVFKISSSMVQLLLSHPDQYELVKADRSLVHNAIEETMRYEGVLTHMPRLVMQDTEFRGVNLVKGRVMYVFHGIANRDPERWENPHKFDVTRKPIQNMGFGMGPHLCIGMHLARHELSHYLNHILDDLPNLRWDPDLDEPPEISGFSFRSPLELPVVWDPIPLN